MTGWGNAIKPTRFNCLAANPVTDNHPPNKETEALE